MIQLPNSFITTFKNVFKEDGDKFLTALPALITEVSARWGLTDVRPVPNLSFHFVAFAKRGEEQVILKMSVPNPELASEIQALKLFNGEGACRVLESDAGRGLLLLERLQPGTMLSELEDDDQRTHIAADVMRRLWRDVPEDADGFIRLSNWFDGLKKIRPHFNGGTGPFPKEILERVESLLPQLFDSPSVLMHGDFHHFNILKSERGWLVIDPKGVIGPAGYEVGPLMINPWKKTSDAHQFKVQTERRISILSERLGWPRETIVHWSLAHAVLSAWWSIEDNMDSEYSMECARIFSGIR